MKFNKNKDIILSSFINKSPIFKIKLYIMSNSTLRVIFYDQSIPSTRRHPSSTNNQSKALSLLLYLHQTPSPAMTHQARGSRARHLYEA